jgi:2-polyprenyl-6-methoxyphenol hydroxylase-like FAD-dependent oxidoreductase
MRERWAGEWAAVLEHKMVARSLTTRCAIAGGGPAGMMLGFLLARAGIDVIVLEKHGDFLRDFRGDTIHPSTLELMHELGILGEFLKLPHREVRRLTGLFCGITVNAADFTALPTTCKFIALMPQWDFLDFLAARGRRYAGFHLLMKAEVTELIEKRGQIVGLRGIAEDGLIDIHADLVIGADGRHSAVRQRAGLKVHDLGAPMDVLWTRISRRPEEDDLRLDRVPWGARSAARSGASRRRSSGVRSAMPIDRQPTISSLSGMPG